MKGKAVADHHKASNHFEKSEIPILAMDYAFMSNRGDRDADQVSEAKILVLKDTHSGYTFGIPVPQKGVDPDEWAVRRIIQVIDFLSHPKSCRRVTKKMCIQK